MCFDKWLPKVRCLKPCRGRHGSAQRVARGLSHLPAPHSQPASARSAGGPQPWSPARVSLRGPAPASSGTGRLRAQRGTVTCARVGPAHGGGAQTTASVRGCSAGALPCISAASRTPGPHAVRTAPRSGSRQGRGRGGRGSVCFLLSVQPRLGNSIHFQNLGFGSGGPAARSDRRRRRSGVSVGRLARWGWAEVPSGGRARSVRVCRDGRPVFCILE